MYSGYSNGETICLWNAESWDLEYVILLEESVILLMIGIRNLTATDIRNPVPGIRIHSVKSRIQDFLGLPYMERDVVANVFFFFILPRSLMSYK